MGQFQNAGRPPHAQVGLHLGSHGGHDVFDAGMGFGMPVQKGLSFNHYVDWPSAQSGVTQAIGNVYGKQKFHSALSLRLQFLPLALIKRQAIAAVKLL